jgi:hypothetical protein
MRKTRVGEYVCTCSAYKFPHRFSGGKCQGLQWVQDLWDKNWGSADCEDCLFNERTHCQVATAQESPIQCPGLQEFVWYEGIVLREE